MLLNNICLFTGHLKFYTIQKTNQSSLSLTEELIRWILRAYHGFQNFLRARKAF